MLLTKYQSGISGVDGFFRTFDATIENSGDDFSNALCNVEIDLASIDTVSKEGRIT